MLKLKPVSSVLAALMIASALSGCGGGGVEPVSKTGGDAQITAAAVEAKAKAAAVAKAKAAAVAKAKAAAVAKAKAAAAAKAKAAAAAAAAAAAEEAAAAAEEAPPPETSVYYENCTAVRAAGADPIYRGEPGYSSKLDRDGDGIACE
jgi:Excalibur calcium-binding domain